MCCRCCSAKQQQIWVFTIAGILMILGILLIIVSTLLYDRILEMIMPLSPGSLFYNNWVVTPVPLYTSFQLYNWTNPHEVNDGRVKPNFQELGPYVFREIKIKEDLKWDENKKFVTYFGRRTWYFEASKSNGSLDDLITAPHLPSAATSISSRHIHSIFRKIMNFFLNREGGKLFVTHTVFEWLFKGVYDDIMDFMQRLNSPLFPIPENHLGYYYNKNNSKEADGSLTMHTGHGDLGKMGDLKYWQGSEYTNYWTGECSRVNGSTGELWSPGKQWHDPVSIFLPEGARYFNIYPQINETNRGLNVWRYTTTELTFDSGHIAEDTKCFCVPERACPKNGAIDFSQVTFGAPVYLSHPHFYMADPSFLENTTGLKPDSKKHGSFVLLEPKLGIPLKLQSQVLISALLEKDDKLEIYKDLAWNFYAPLFAFKIEAEITDDLLRFVKLGLNFPSIGLYAGISLLTVGLIMIAVGIYMTGKHKWKGEANNKDK